MDRREIDVIIYKQSEGAKIKSVKIPKPTDAQGIIKTKKIKSPRADRGGSAQLTDIFGGINSPTLLSEAFIISTVNQLKNKIAQTITFSIKRYIDLTEDYIGQNNLSQAGDAIGRAYSFGSAVYAGFALGGWLGAGIAGVGALVFDNANLISRQQQAYLNLNNQNIDRGFARQRLGLIDNGRGTEN